MVGSGFGVGCSLHPVPSTAIGEAVGDVLEQAGTGADLVVVFASSQLAGTFSELLQVAEAVLRPTVLIGATSSAVSANGTDTAGHQSVAVWAGQVGEVTPFLLTASGRPSTDGTPNGGLDGGLDGGLTVSGTVDVNAAALDAGTLLLLADPLSFPAQEWLSTIVRTAPALSVCGGFVSAGGAATRLALGTTVVSEGAVGLLFHRAAAVRTFLSHGFRPIGQAFTVTRAERNVVYELGGIPARERLDDVVASLTGAERAPLRSGIHLGIVVNEHRFDYEPEDFVVRSVLGADRETGALAVDHEIAVGTIVQFQCRDPRSAAVDLERRIASGTHDSDPPRAQVSGSLLFRNTARTPSRFEPGHDDAANLFALTGAPSAGISCVGEFGALGAADFVHTDAASVVMFS